MVSSRRVRIVVYCIARQIQEAREREASTQYDVPQCFIREGKHQISLNRVVSTSGEGAEHCREHRAHLPLLQRRSDEHLYQRATSGRNHHLTVAAESNIGETCDADGCNRRIKL